MIFAYQREHLDYSKYQILNQGEIKIKWKIYKYSKMKNSEKSEQ